MPEPGLILVVSAPSGAGKTTLCRTLVDRRKDCVFSVSVTTRPCRGGETDGADYHFVEKEEFKRRIEAGELAEWAEVHGEYYGTARQTVDQITGRGDTLVLDIDVQGGRQIKRAYPDAVLVFIIPPTFEELKRRLEGRRTENGTQIAKRMENAREEVRVAGNYSYLIVNDGMEKAVHELECVLEAERCRMRRNRSRIDNFFI